MAQPPSAAEPTDAAAAPPPAPAAAAASAAASEAAPPPLREVYARLLRYVRPYALPFSGAIVAMALTAASDAALPAVLKFLLDHGFRPADDRLVVLIPLGLVALFVVRGGLIYATGYTMASITGKVVMDLRNAMFARLLVLPTARYDDASSGGLISKVVFDVNNVAAASSTALVAVVRESLTVVCLIGYLVYVDWRLTLIALCIAPVIITVVRRFGKRLRAANRSGYRAIGDLTHILEEATGAHKVVKVFGGQDAETRRFQAASTDYRRALLREAIPASATVPITQIALSLALAVIIYLALASARGPQGTTVGDFVSFITALIMLLAPVKRLSEVNTEIQRGLTAAQSVFALLDEAGEPDRGVRTLDRARGEVRFERVAFRYEGANRAALDGIDFSVRAGEVVALVGPSGGGKTSLVSLLPRFYAPSTGRIFIDGIDTQELTLASLRAQIALVSQDVVLFNDTVAANIAYGAAAGCTEAEVIAAARAAHAWEFIQQMPQGLATLVGENGVKLSGGQRQRLAIARALLKDAPILILDEATSALDTESERQVQEALAALMRARTTFVIAHRLSTIEGADRILVLDHARIVESGRHDELLRHGGVYAHLYRLQFKPQPSAAGAAVVD
jgi:subfamily B ATP-binding cassette protein MsbA